MLFSYYLYGDYMKEFKYISNKKKSKPILFTNEEDRISDTRIEISDNDLFFLEGCLGVEDYKGDYIKLKIKKGYIDIYGRDLNILYFENKEIKILGFINTIEYIM